jgi:hypothetical protein
MGIEEYIAGVKQRIENLKEFYPRLTTLEIKEAATAKRGVFESDLKGTHERIGYVLNVNYEYMGALPDGTFYPKKYRYRILRGTDELIRFQTARNGFPENAHFPPHFLSEDGAEHFTIERYPAHMKAMNFQTIFQFYLDLVRADGELPEPFKSARPLH